MVSLWLLLESERKINWRDKEGNSCHVLELGDHTQIFILLLHLLGCGKNMKNGVMDGEWSEQDWSEVDWVVTIWFACSRPGPSLDGQMDGCVDILLSFFAGFIILPSTSTISPSS